MGRRRRAREYALQILFQIDVSGDAADDVLAGFWADREVEEEVRAFAVSLATGVDRTREDLDRRIVASATHWRLERMPVVDRNVLRIAVFEMLREDAPAAVVIDEAIEIAGKFGSGDSGKFINGVLDAIRRRMEDECLRAGTETGKDG